MFFSLHSSCDFALPLSFVHSMILSRKTRTSSTIGVCCAQFSHIWLKLWKGITIMLVTSSVMQAYHWRIPNNYQPKRDYYQPSLKYVPLRSTMLYWNMPNELSDEICPIPKSTPDIETWNGDFWIFHWNISVDPCGTNNSQKWPATTTQQNFSSRSMWGWIFKSLNFPL